MRRDRVVQLRRQRAGEPLADEDDRLAPLAQAAEPDRGALERAHRHLVADRFDRRGRIVGVPLLELVARLVVELAPLELLDGADQRSRLRVKVSAGDRRQRIHDRDHVRRRRAGSAMKSISGFRDRHVVAAPHVIVVEQQDEQAHVRAASPRSPRRRAADLARRSCRRLPRADRSSPRRRSRPSGLLSSRDLELFLLQIERPASPFLSVTMTSTRTKLMPVRMTGGRCQPAAAAAVPVAGRRCVELAEAACAVVLLGVGAGAARMPTHAEHGAQREHGLPYG